MLNPVIYLSFIFFLGGCTIDEDVVHPGCPVGVTALYNACLDEVTLMDDQICEDAHIIYFRDMENGRRDSIRDRNLINVIDPTTIRVAIPAAMQVSNLLVGVGFRRPCKSTQDVQFLQPEIPCPVLNDPDFIARCGNEIVELSGGPFCTSPDVYEAVFPSGITVPVKAKNVDTLEIEVPVGAGSGMVEVRLTSRSCNDGNGNNFFKLQYLYKVVEDRFLVDDRSNLLFSGIRGLAVKTIGPKVAEVYGTDVLNQQIIKVPESDIFITDGKIERYAGCLSPTQPNCTIDYNPGQISTSSARFSFPTDLSIAPARDHLVVISSGREQIRRIDTSSDLVDNLAGFNTCGTGGNSVVSCQATFPFLNFGIAISPSGKTFVVHNNELAEISSDDSRTCTLSCTGEPGITSIAGTVNFHPIANGKPDGLEIDPNGNQLLLAFSKSHEIMAADLDNINAPFTPLVNYSTTQPQFAPIDLAVDHHSSTVFFIDAVNSLIGYFNISRPNDVYILKSGEACSNDQNSSNLLINSPEGIAIHTHHDTMGKALYLSSMGNIRKLTLQ